MNLRPWVRAGVRSLVLLVCLSGGVAAAADKYVRAGGSDSNSGNDWTNAEATISACVDGVGRGDTCWVGNGSVGSDTLNKAASGTSVVTIKKATIASHGTATGWSDSYAAQATIPSLIIKTSYWTIDGATRDEGDWDDDTAYGIKLTSIDSIEDIGTDTVCPDSITLRYLDVGGPESSTYTGSEPDYAVKNSCFTLGTHSEWLLERSRFHNIAHFAILHQNGLSNSTMQYNWIGPGWGKEAIRGQINWFDNVVRWNWFYNACGSAPPDGCTAEIASWDGTDFSGNHIYGNVFRCNSCDGNTSAVVILVGGDGGSWVGPSASDTLIFNNTITGSSSTSWNTTPNIDVNGGTGNICRNNLWYLTVGTPGASCNTTSDNEDAASDPFVSHSTGDFHLSGAKAGVSTSSPAGNATDLDGVTRGNDGTWDRGAFEVEEGGAPSPTAPYRLPRVRPGDE